MSGGGVSERLVELYELEELTQPPFLVSSQPLRLGEHAFDHLLDFVPIAVNARVHELLAGSRSRAMRRDDVGDQGSKLINHLHRETSFDVNDES